MGLESQPLTRSHCQGGFIAALPSKVIVLPINHLSELFRFYIAFLIGFSSNQDM
jgi:hypothetical protein